LLKKSIFGAINKMNVLITGTTSGIGWETAIELAKKGYQLFLLNRSTEKTHRLIDHLKKITPQAKVHFIPIELDRLSSVKEAATKFLELAQPLDLLINNAGLLGQKGLTQDGYELAFGTNHLGHFLLTHLVRPAIVKTPNSRIIILASNAHRQAEFTNWNQVKQKTKSLIGYPEYGFSKVCNIWHAQEIAQQEEYAQVKVYCVHPGVIKTDIWRNTPPPINLINNKLFLKDAKEGAKRVLFCAFTEKSFKKWSIF
jgi:NAD(P)-dependent dehydrogenase (short-subunit alcohol dehydrogenase family)